MNFDRLRFVAERATLGEQKEALLAATIPERPGAFADLVKACHPAGITEFSYRHSGANTARVIIGTSISKANLPALVERVTSAGMAVKDLSANEVAKSHVRYLIGGRPHIKDEHLYNFEFPERTGALYRFLTKLTPGFNISLFHYRNSGGDVARILAGIQVPSGEEHELEAFLKRVGYPYKEETNNESYQMFLKSDS